MKILYRIGADAIWLAHFAVVSIAVFGWLLPSIWPLYVAVLVGTLISTYSFGYCVLSKWEYDLRRMVRHDIAYDFSYASYYTYRLTHGYISALFLARAGVLFCGASLALNIYFRYIY